MSQDYQDAANNTNDLQMTLALPDEDGGEPVETRGLFSKTYLARHLRADPLFASASESTDPADAPRIATIYNGLCGVEGQGPFDEF